MFCASCSSTPQLTTGGRSPRPRKLSAVSARIIAGIASVTEAMMWLMNDGTMCATMMRSSLAAVEPRRGDEILVAQRQEPPRTTRASPVQPISDRMTVIAK